MNMYVRSDKGPGAYPFSEKYISYGLQWLKARGIDTRCVPIRALMHERNIWID